MKEKTNSKLINNDKLMDLYNSNPLNIIPESLMEQDSLRAPSAL